MGENGWLRKIRFSRPAPKMKDVLPVPDSPGGATTKPSGISVEKWVDEMLAVPATPARSQSFRSPAVLAQSFSLGDDRLGIILVNLRRGVEESARLTVDPLAVGLRAGAYDLTQATTDQVQKLGSFENRREVEVRLPPAGVVLLAAARAEH